MTRKLSDLKPLEIVSNPELENGPSPLNTMKISLKLNEDGQNHIFL